ncbi:MAG: ABC transporter substrate-binding protein [Verrucomicrobiota bacterium]|nr:ABC transporter substrate-binding protein [Verrucomicrobiota bacterium]
MYIHRFHKQCRLSAVLSFFIALMLMTSVRSVHAEDYQLGVILGLTGGGAIWSNEGLEAITMAVDEINAEGGLLKKYPIKLTVVDDQAKPDVAAQVARNMVTTTKPNCVIGTWSSSCALAIKPIFAESKTLHLAAISNSEDITRLNPSPYTYSVVPNTYMLAKAISIGLAKLSKEKGWKTYATITSDYAFGRSMQSNVVTMLKTLAPELSMTKDVWVPLSETQWAPHFAALAAAKPDFINVTLTSDDSVRFINMATPTGFFKKYPCPGMMLSVTELILQKDLLPRGVTALTRAPFFGHPDEPAMQSLVEKWKKAHNRYPTDWQVLHYDALMILKQAVEKAGTIETEAVRAALHGSTVNTCRGKLTFRTLDNQLICPVYVGTVADDPAYPFPIYHNMQVIPGAETMRPEAEIVAARETK